MESYLRTFLSVCETGSIKAAAKILHRSEPAVSYQIRSLERDCGTQLFDRVGRRIVSNQNGRFLYAAAQPLIHGVDAAANALRTPTLQTAPPLSISTVSGFGRYVLAPILARLHALSVRLSFCTAEETWAALKAGKADVGFTFKRTFDPALEFLPVYREELVLISAKPLKRFDAAAAAEVPYVTYEEGDWVFSKWFEEVLGHQPRGIRSTHHVDELEEVIRFVNAGMGISIVPLDAANAEIKKRQLSVYWRRNKRCFNWVFIVTRASAQPSITVDTISKALSSQSRQQPRDQGIRTATA